MAKIATFTQTDDGFAGTMCTFTMRAELMIQKAQKTSDKGPDYRVFHHSAEIGAAWTKTSKDNTPFLSVTIDDPTFAAPIRAVLLKKEGDQYQLIWNR